MNLGDLSLLSLREPLWLLFALQPAVLLLLLRLMINRKQTYADPHLLPWVRFAEDPGSRRKQYLRQFFYSLAWILFAVSAAGPRLPDPIDASPLHKGTDIMTIVDVSRSMQAADIQPNRLKRARIELAQLISMLKGERIGTILYAGKAHLFHPLTRDYALAKYYLEGIEENLLPTAGSNLNDALRLAAEELDKGGATTGAILLITDGDFTEESITRLTDSPYPLYILGIGTQEGSPVAQAGGGWLTDNGTPILSRMNRIALERLAEKTRGDFVQISADNRDLETLYDKGIRGLQRSKGQPEDSDLNWQELYPWTLIPATLILLSLSLPADRRKPLILAPAISLVALFFMFYPGLMAFADEIDPSLQLEAQRSLQEQHYDNARQIYSRIKGYTGRMGEGVCAYRLKDYGHATVLFSEAALLAKSEPQRANALYNLGNSYFMQKNYPHAIESFRDALRYDPQLSIARDNLEFTEAVLRDLPDNIQQSDAASRRAGRGPRTRSANPQDGSLGSYSMDEEEQKPKKATEADPNAPSSLHEQIASGEQRATVVMKNIDQNTAEGWGKPSPTEITQAKRIAEQIRDKQSLLWKSLFEEEEGFPAPVDEPRPLPGIRPW